MLTIELWFHDSNHDLGPIEKGASDGQMSYATSLSAALRNAVAAKSGTAKGVGKPGKQKKRSKTQIADETVPAPTTSPTATGAQGQRKNWGMLEPVRSLLGPVADILDSVITTQSVVIVLALLLIYSWFFRSPATGATPAHMSVAQRQIAYEELWRAEEADLWSWLEERVALDRVHSAASAARVLQGHEIQSKLVAESMKARQIDEAIRTTEEKLAALKHAVKRDRETLTKSPREKQT